MDVEFLIMLPGCENGYFFYVPHSMWKIVKRYRLYCIAEQSVTNTWFVNPQAGCGTKLHNFALSSKLITFCSAGRGLST